MISAFGALSGPRYADDLMGRKLIAGKIKIEPAESIPPVPAESFAMSMDLSTHQFTAEEIVQHQRRDRTMPARPIGLRPFVDVIGRAGIEGEGAPNRLLDLLQRERDHGCQVCRQNLAEPNGADPVLLKEWPVGVASNNNNNNNNDHNFVNNNNEYNNNSHDNYDEHNDYIGYNLDHNDNHYDDECHNNYE